MTAEKKAEMRKLIDNPVSDWKRYGIIDEEPSVLYWHGDKELEVCYEDMDGNAKVCRAVYEHPCCGVPRFIAMSGLVRGTIVKNVFAYREDN